MGQSIFVTGADGFLGSALCAALVGAGHSVTGATRACDRNGFTPIGDIADFERWAPLLEGVDTVIHAAGRAHVVHETTADPLAEFRRVNVEATANLARAALLAGVKRFVFVSSIGVNGHSTDDKPFTESDVPRPSGPYALSKWEAEIALQEVANTSGLELVIVRPPLIVGPGAKGNLLRLLRLINAGIPLPFGRVRNRRSFVGVRNLCDLLALAASHPGAAGGLFLAADDRELSLPQLLQLTATAMNCRLRLISLPLAPMRGLASMLGRRQELDRLTQSLTVDASAARSRLGWNPRVALEQEIAAMASWFSNLHDEAST